MRKAQKHSLARRLLRELIKRGDGAEIVINGKRYEVTGYEISLKHGAGPESREFAFHRLRRAAEQRRRYLSDNKKFKPLHDPLDRRKRATIRAARLDINEARDYNAKRTGKGVSFYV